MRSFPPRLRSARPRFAVVLAFSFLALASVSQAQTLLLQLQAANYNAATGTWTDTSGLNNNATQLTLAARPTLVTGVTPNGSSAVSFTTGTFLSLTLGITAGNATGYTAFVFLQPSTLNPNGFTNGNGGTIFGGPTAGTFQYRIMSNLGTQDTLRSSQADLGHGNTALSVNPATTPNSPNFSSINATVGPAGGTYRLNGAADGTTTASTFTQAISIIGANAGNNGSEFFNGDIAEIRIYSGVMDDTQRAAIEAEFRNSYVTVPEPGTYAMMLGGLGLMLLVQRHRRRSFKA